MSKKQYRKLWEKANQRVKKCKKEKKFSNILKNKLEENISQNMTQIQIQNKLNPLKYNLSSEARKRLKWIYITHYDCNKNISKASVQIGISRQWLSKIYNTWKTNNKDPRLLEPKSKTPTNTSNRKRIDISVENKIVEIRKEFPWGKKKIAEHLTNDYKMPVGGSTVNRIFWKHGLINVKISNKNKLAHKNKVEQKQRTRPPKEIKDYKPGALLEKDMKFVRILSKNNNFDKPKAKENFWLQHSLLDSFTRVKTYELVECGSAKTAKIVYKKAVSRLPFKVGAINTDNGSENLGSFEDYLKSEDTFHFYSRSGTPTDNPRVERSHLTDEIELYQQGGIKQTFKKQQAALLDFEYVYNYVRPHQALGYKTPMAFYELWKKDPDEAYKITAEWQTYLAKQRVRLATSRRVKKKEKIEKMMEQIDKRLNGENSTISLEKITSNC